MTIKSKLNGTEKFWLVFYELEDALGDEVSFEELAQATKTLLNVSKKEYVEKTYRDTKERANYYTRDTDRMIENDHCLPLSNEYTGYDFDQEDVVIGQFLMQLQNFMHSPLAR